MAPHSRPAWGSPTPQNGRTVWLLRPRLCCKVSSLVHLIQILLISLLLNAVDISQIYLVDSWTPPLLTECPFMLPPSIYQRQVMECSRPFPFLSYVIHCQEHVGFSLAYLTGLGYVFRATVCVLYYFSFLGVGRWGRHDRWNDVWAGVLLTAYRVTHSG